MGDVEHNETAPPGGYRRRIVDDELDELIAGLPAIALEGPKAVGKTATALRRAATVHRLDDSAERSVAEIDTSRLVEGKRPILIDQWQRVPESFDRVRRAVDAGAPPGASCSPARRHPRSRLRTLEPAGSCRCACDPWRSPSAASKPRR